MSNLTYYYFLQIVILLIALSASAFMAKRLMRLLHYFKQTNYDHAVFLNWIWTNGLDRFASLWLVLLGGTSGVVASPLFPVLAMAAMMAAFLREPNPCRADRVKIPLVMSQRDVVLLAITFAWVSFWMLLFLSQIDWAIHGPGYPVALILVISIQILPLVLVVANLMLWPFDQLERAHIERVVRKKLQRFRPTVIAVAGSFGKTSCAHILGRILAAHEPCMVTPFDAGTIENVTKAVQESLEPSHRYLVLELSTRRPGQIAKACQLFQPDHGVITSVGVSFSNRLKRVSDVAQAQLELAGPVMAKGGMLVVNGQAIDEEFWPKGVSFVSEQDQNERAPIVRISDVCHHSEGLSLTLWHEGRAYAVQSGLWGKDQAANMALAFALAVRCGVSPALAATTLNAMTPLPHRREVCRHKEAPTVIDDTIGANSVGFVHALDVLNFLAKETGGRRILITPGLINLGLRHNIEHRFLGECSARRVDIALVITPSRISHFLQGLEAAEEPELHIETFYSARAARAWLANNAQPLDVVLYENDLPDLYEMPPGW